MRNSMTILNDKGFEIAFDVRRDLDIPIDKAVDLNEISEKLNIAVREKDLKSEILGACRTDGIKRKILLHNGITNFQKKRFTWAHEIGHLLIHQGTFYCKTDYFNSLKTQSEIEMEANSFAAELLISRKIIIATLKKKDLSIENIRSMSSLYDVSLSAASIQMTKFYDDAAITLFHSDDKIIWSTRSAENYYKSPKIIPSIFSSSAIEKSLVNPKLWLEDEIEGLCCEQESIYFNKLDKYLTILKFYLQ